VSAAESQAIALDKSGLVQPVCVLCIGEARGCPRCHDSGIDPDPLAPVLDEAS
jgi:hypothetical protein